jgi:hypothetical protein
MLYSIYSGWMDAAKNGLCCQSGSLLISLIISLIEIIQIQVPWLELSDVEVWWRRTFSQFLKQRGGEE